MKRICVVTATRAEYGLLSPIIHALKECHDFDVRIVATGAHLSPEFGFTYREIEEDGNKIDRKIEILLSADTASGISKSMGLAIIGFADYFAECRPDALIVLGDRYEMLAICCAAMNERIPIIHLYGGETTEGAVDEAIRHAITKLSYLHLTSTEEYRKRVIQLGESPERVFTVGAVGIENALSRTLMTKKELAESIGINLDIPYALVTFHPVTLEDNSAQKQCEELVGALDKCPGMGYIVTKANADVSGKVINSILELYASEHNNVKVVDSLGSLRYLSAIKYARMVIGNSSSGLIEVPSFGIPTVNIGDRQEGRIKAKSVIDCEPVRESIFAAMKKAETEAFRNICKASCNPYGDGHTSDKVIKAIKEMFTKRVNLKKEFYDLLK